MVEFDASKILLQFLAGGMEQGRQKLAFLSLLRRFFGPGQFMPWWCYHLRNLNYAMHQVCLSPIWGSHQHAHRTRLLESWMVLGSWMKSGTLCKAAQDVLKVKSIRCDRNSKVSHDDKCLRPSKLFTLQFSTNTSHAVILYPSIGQDGCMNLKLHPRDTKYSQQFAPTLQLAKILIEHRNSS